MKNDLRKILSKKGLTTALSLIKEARKFTFSDAQDRKGLTIILNFGKQKNQEGKNMPKGVRQGQKRGFTKAQVAEIKKNLIRSGNLQHLALFFVAIDSMLRVGDLLSLQVSDVLDVFEKVRDEPNITQIKTKVGVKLKLLPKTREVLKQFIEKKDLKPNDFLFANRAGKQLSTDWYRRLIKKWAAEIKLDPKDYSGHSTRRSKANLLYETYRDFEIVRIGLGHKSLAATIAYLGVEEKRVMDRLRECEM